MKNVLIITGLALSLISANAFANGKKRAAQAAATVTRGAEGAATGARAARTAQQTVRLDSGVKAVKGAQATATATGSNATSTTLDTSARAKAGAQAAPAAAVSNLNASARAEKPAQAAAVSAEKPGAVCIGGKYYSSGCGKFGTSESQGLVRQIIDNESNPSEISQSLAQAQGISVDEASDKVSALIEAGCIVKN